MCVFCVVRNRHQVITRTNMYSNSCDEAMIHNLQESDKMSQSIITPNYFYGGSYKVHSKLRKDYKNDKCFSVCYVVICNDMHME